MYKYIALAALVACTPLPKFDDETSVGDQARGQFAGNVPSSADATSTSQALDDDLATLLLGKPTATQQAAGVTLKSALTDAELGRLAAIDWKIASSSSLLAEPAFLKAAVAVEPSLARSIKTSPATSSDTYSCLANECTTVKGALDRAAQTLSTELANGSTVAAGTPLGQLAPKGSKCPDFATSDAPTNVICAGLVAYVIGEQLVALANMTCTITAPGTVIVQSLGQPSTLSDLDDSCK